MEIGIICLAERERRNILRKFIDTETGKSITESELLAEFTALKSENPEEYPYNFNQYLRNCTDKNGFLREV